MPVHSEKYSFIDVGNTSIVLKYYDKGQFVSTKRFLTQHFNLKSFENFIKKSEKVFIASVVPSVDDLLEKIFYKNKVEAFFLTQERSHLIDYSQREGVHLGADIVAQLEAGAMAFKESPFCVVSMGTAITMISVDIQKQFVGGLIMADYKMQLAALHHFTAKLPVIPYHLNQNQNINDNLFHKQTVTAIQSGTYNLIYYGIKGILGEMKKKDSSLKVIGTGGISLYFKDLFDKQDENLLFLGLYNIYKNEINE